MLKTLRCDRAGLVLGLLLALSHPAWSENYLSTMISQMRGQSVVDQIPDELREKYFEIQVAESHPDFDSLQIAERYAQLDDESLPPDARSFLQAERAHQLEVANRHPLAIELMREIIRSRPEAKAEEIRYYLHLEIARVMAQSGGHPLIEGFDPTIEEKAAAFADIFARYYPYRYEVMMSHLSFYEECHNEAYNYPETHGQYMDTAIEELTTALRLAVDIRVNPALAYDDRTLNDTQYFLDYCSDQLPVLRQRRQHLRDILAEGQYGDKGKAYVAHAWTDPEPDPSGPRDNSIEPAVVTRTRLALEESRKTPYEKQPNRITPASGAWVMVDAGPFTMSLPPSLQRIPTQGVDSLVGRYRDDTIELGFDYGWYSNRLDDIAGSTVEQVRIDGRTARMVQFKRDSPALSHGVGVHVPNLIRSRHGTTSLTMVASCRTELDAETAVKIFQSIRFKPAEE